MRGSGGNHLCLQSDHGDSRGQRGGHHSDRDRCVGYAALWRNQNDGDGIHRTRRVRLLLLRCRRGCESAVIVLAVARRIRQPSDRWNAARFDRMWLREQQPDESRACLRRGHRTVGRSDADDHDKPHGAVSAESPGRRLTKGGRSIGKSSAEERSRSTASLLIFWRVLNPSQRRGTLRDFTNYLVTFKDNHSN